MPDEWLDSFMYTPISREDAIMNTPIKREDTFINTPISRKDTFINTPMSRGDREAKDADWSSIVDHVDFDISECYDFIILELGVRMQIPMKFEYAQGIVEVERRLWLRYGETGFEEAMAVFNVIMKFSDPDLVHADEAPQWNSWRGDYRRGKVSSYHGRERIMRLIIVIGE